MFEIVMFMCAVFISSLIMCQHDVWLTLQISFVKIIKINRNLFVSVPPPAQCCWSFA